MGKTKDFTVKIGGKKHKITSDDDYMKARRKEFEPETVKLCRAVGDGSQTILDIGANIGCTAIFLSELGQTVHSFEPSPSTFKFLEMNVSRAGKGNVELHNCGLGAEPGETTLTFAPSNRSGAFVSNQTQASAGHNIENIAIRQLDEVVDSLGLTQIDFIKIDVEGFEQQVLLGAVRTLAANKPMVVLELNHWCLNAFQRTSVPDFFDFLTARFPILLAVEGSGYLDLHKRRGPLRGDVLSHSAQQVFELGGRV